MLDNRTHDNIRYANQECFHKDGKCTLECCECSSDCKVFIWNVTILKNTVNNSFGCQSRIEADGITYKAMVLIRHNSSDRDVELCLIHYSLLLVGFSIPNKTVVPIKGYNPIITIRPSISDVPSGTKIENDETELNTTAMHSNSVIINNADSENKVETTTFPPNTTSIKQNKVHYVYNEQTPGNLSNTLLCRWDQTLYHCSKQHCEEHLKTLTGEFNTLLNSCKEDLTPDNCDAINARLKDLTTIQS
ncbi:unnamed protein product [Mytilus coruscus]|uniref:Uncharacterized protein n=1 Tax=Mytilus coruscus TaxID=42192 RepID=A0A6J8BKP0_MYTCO|nr:unnamed protein product [Mytilus coruscus]